jgi:putative oxidoreductase
MFNPVMAALRQKQSSALGLFILRLATGAIFIYHGWPKLSSPAGIIGFFGKIGIPAPEFFVPFVGFVEVVGGLCLILGLITRFWAAGLAIDMAVAILAAKGLAKFTGYEFELLLLAVSLFLFFHGAGRWSVDARIVPPGAADVRR